MKKTRRIEITSFRRRTTIGVNRQEDGNDAERPHYYLDISSHQVPTEQPSAEGSDLNTQPPDAFRRVTTRERKRPK
jgi:hypothetical protein